MQRLSNFFQWGEEIEDQWKSYRAQMEDYVESLIANNEALTDRLQTFETQQERFSRKQRASVSVHLECSESESSDLENVTLKRNGFEEFCLLLYFIVTLKSPKYSKRMFCALKMPSFAKFMNFVRFYFCYPFLFRSET